MKQAVSLLALASFLFSGLVIVTAAVAPSVGINPILLSSLLSMFTATVLLFKNIKA